MKRNLDNAVVVVTGASSGIGRATALRFAAEHCTLIVTARREEALQDLVGECERMGARAMELPCDVTDAAALEELARQIVDTYGRIDVWVNNAAVSALGKFEETPLDVFRQIIDTNLFGYVHGMRAALPHFRQQGYGVLINVASIVGRTGQPYASAYAASKAAIIGLTESVRMEMKDSPEIHLCAVLPATIDTPLFQHAANFSGREVKAMPPVYSPEQVADAIVNCAMNPKDEVTVGNAATMLRWLHRLSPTMVEAMFAKQVDQEHFTDQPAGATTGNVFEPQPWGTSVEGGWGGKAAHGHHTTALSGAAMAAGVGVGLLAAWGLSRGGGAKGPMKRRRR